MNISQPKLFMLLLGCKPAGRHTEQHDVFFGIGDSLKDLVPAMHAFWPEAKKNLHADAWREVHTVQQYTIRARLKTEATETVDTTGALNLFFINLGGYRKGEFEEHHYKMLIVAKDADAAVALAKKETFYKQNGFKGASAHIDDKYGIDADDVYSVQEILPEIFSSRYTIEITPATETETVADNIHLGYLPLWKIT
jgi:hypothetical protein